MLGLVCTQKVYLACGSTDMRKSIDSLAAIVQQSFSLDPFSTALFVFCNKSRDKIKILPWDHNGFWLFTTKGWRKGSLIGRREIPVQQR
jgi:transposase